MEKLTKIIKSKIIIIIAIILAIMAFSITANALKHYGIIICVVSSVVACFAFYGILQVAKSDNK